MRRRNGFTLVEVITSVFILCIVVLGTVKFYRSINNAVETTNTQASIDVNLRIAQEFMAYKVRSSNTIILRAGIINIDGKELFVRDEMLRYGTASQHISPNVMKISIENLGQDLYRVSTIGQYESLTSIVKRGDSIEK
ncbi:MAG: prepilin-type N-terminal cleavage/methylation domain-containing protein [Clostridium sp.]